MNKLLNTDIESFLDLQSPLDIQALLVVILIILVVALILSLVITGSRYRLFVKAGEDGWKAFIPIYSTYIMVKLGVGEDKVWLMLGMLLSVATAFISNTLLSSTLSLIATVFGAFITYGFLIRYSDKGMAIAGVFLPLIIFPILAFSKKYQYKPLIEEDSFDEVFDEDFFNN